MVATGRQVRYYWARMGGRRALRRHWLVAVVAAALLGCTPTSSASPEPVTPEPTEVAISCPHDLPVALVDGRLGYGLCMPAGWRDLGFNHAAWVEAFGDASELEGAFLSGNVDHVAVPLGPGDDDNVSHLSIDSSELGASDTLEDRRDAFVDGNVELGAKLLSSAIVELDGTRAARAALDFSEMQGSTSDGRLILYLVPTTSVLLSLQFTTDGKSLDEHEPVFDAMAATLQLQEPAR
jgi:hypothetical protein